MHPICTRSSFENSRRSSNDDAIHYKEDRSIQNHHNCRRVENTSNIRNVIEVGEYRRGLRSGTLNVPGIVGMGKAVELANAEQQKRIEHTQELRDYMWSELNARLDDIVLNGPSTDGERLQNNLNVSFLGVENKALVRKLRSDIAVSAGSACTTGSVEASHVLQAIGGAEDQLHSAIRFGFGKDNTEKEIDQAIDCIEDAVTRLRRFSF
ncbi:cysteine desulfurase family protein [Natrialba hulunbeirensis]|uniref:cysteine desulfurase family protein n=1 Tax=Natrialba hulunbeirensis TaxID=123783 RepID=UPI0023A9EF81|nr:aminotransferase class V-fold PLP-dependent enzyme [Natrialba hulunbeirensis]